MPTGSGVVMDEGNNQTAQQAGDVGDYQLVSRTLGGLPMVNHIRDRLGLAALLGQALGEVDGRAKLAPAKAQPSAGQTSFPVCVFQLAGLSVPATGRTAAPASCGRLRARSHPWWRVNRLPCSHAEIAPARQAEREPRGRSRRSQARCCGRGRRRTPCVH